MKAFVTNHVSFERVSNGSRNLSKTDVISTVLARIAGLSVLMAVLFVILWGADSPVLTYTTFNLYAAIAMSAISLLLIICHSFGLDPAFKTKPNLCLVVTAIVSVCWFIRLWWILAYIFV